MADCAIAVIFVIVGIACVVGDSTELRQTRHGHRSKITRDLDLLPAVFNTDNKISAKSAFKFSNDVVLISKNASDIRKRSSDNNEEIDDVTRQVLAAGGLNVTSSSSDIVNPLSFMTSSAYLVTKLKIHETFSISFKFKTTQTDGIIFYSGFTSVNSGDFMAIELDNGHIRYAFDVGSGTRVMNDRLSVPVSDNSWHSVTVNRPSVRRHVLIVDGRSSVDVLPDSRSVHFDLPSDDLHVGGVEKRFLELQRLKRRPLAGSVQVDQGAPSPPHRVGRVKALEGFQGCLASIELSGEPFTLTERRVDIDDQFLDQIVEGCKGPSSNCSTTTCSNGGKCVQQWNSAICDCEMTSFTGPSCDDDGVAYTFGRHGGLISVTFGSDERLDTQRDRVVLGLMTSPQLNHGHNNNAMVVRITSETSNDFIEIFLVGGIVHCMYNMGKSTHRLSEPDIAVNDGVYHVIRFTRHGANSTLQVDDLPMRYRQPNGRQLTTFNQLSTVSVGAMKDASGQRIRTFHGTVAGVVVNGHLVLEMAADKDLRAAIEGDVEITVTSLNRSKLSSTQSPSLIGQSSTVATEDQYTLLSPAESTRRSSPKNRLPISGSDCETSECSERRSMDDAIDSTSASGTRRNARLRQPSRNSAKSAQLTPNGDGVRRSSTTLGQVNGNVEQAAVSDSVSSGHGPGCHKSSPWSDNDDDEDCMVVVDDSLQSSGDGSRGHSKGQEGLDGAKRPAQKSQTKNPRMEKANTNFMPNAGAVSSNDDRHNVDFDRSSSQHRGPEIVNGKHESQAATPVFVWAPEDRARLSTPAPMSLTSHGRLSASRPAVWTETLPQRASTSSPISRVTLHSSAHQQQSRGHHQHSQSSSSSSLGLNIVLIIGIGAGVVILTIIVGYSVYRYRAGCLQGGQHGSYRLDDASAPCVGNHHPPSLGDPLDIGKMASAGPGSRLLLPVGGGGGPVCSPSDGVGLINGGQSDGLIPQNGATQMTRSSSKSNCKVPTKEWYV